MYAIRSYYGSFSITVATPVSIIMGSMGGGGGWASFSINACMARSARSWAANICCMTRARNSLFCCCGGGGGGAWGGGGGAGGGSSWRWCAWGRRGLLGRAECSLSWPDIHREKLPRESKAKRNNFV